MVLAQPCRFAARRDRDAPSAAAAAGGEGDRASIVLGPPWESQSFFGSTTRVRGWDTSGGIFGFGGTLFDEGWDMPYKERDPDRDRQRKAEWREKQRLAREAEKAADDRIVELDAEAEEQRVRDLVGYARSEDRSKAERRAAADRMLAKCGVEPQDVKAGYLAEAEFWARALSARREESKTDEEARVKRAAEYAEWRWDGFHAGEISSL